MQKMAKIIQKQRKILKKSYDDRMDILRSQKVRTELGETKLIRESIYTDIPCYLSIGSVKSSERDEVIANVNNDYLIFAEPHILLYDNDEVHIRKGDMTYKGRSAKTYVYDTHGETSVRIEGVV